MFSDILQILFILSKKQLGCGWGRAVTWVPFVVDS
jgi:hypothetical protein